MKTSFVALIAVVAGVVLAQNVAEPVYTNDFESGLDGFTMTDAKAWELADDNGNTVLALARKSFYMPKVRSPQSIAWIDGVDMGSFVFEADLKQTGIEYDHRDLCLFFNKQDAEHYYYVHMATHADDRANSIFIVNGEPRNSIAIERTDGTQWGQDWHHVKIVRDAESGSIEVYFDDMGAPAMRANDSTFTSGAIGIGSFDDVGYFDNLVIRPLVGE